MFQTTNQITMICIDLPHVSPDHALMPLSQRPNPANIVSRKHVGEVPPSVCLVELGLENHGKPTSGTAVAHCCSLKGNLEALHGQI